MQEVLDKMFAVADRPYDYLNRWKSETNKKIIGCLPMYFPEEIIHASGALPIVVPEGEEPISVGHSRVQNYICGYARSTLDIALKGRLSFIDGWVSDDVCHSTRGLAMLIEWDVKPAFYRAIYFPQIVNVPYARDYLTDQLKTFKGDLEKFTGKEITGELLGNSIHVYNKHRALLRKVYDARRSNPGVISGRQMWAIVSSGMLMPKEKHIKLLEQLLESLKAKKPAAAGKIKVVLSGSLCESAPVQLFDLIEQIGAVIVDDDLYVGSRYVGKDVNPALEPLEGLADRFLTMAPPCPTRVNGEGDWAEYLVDMVRRAKAQAVISIMAKYCEPHAMAYPSVVRMLKATGIPELTLETEHGDVPRGQYRTRLEAFVEMIR